MKISALSLALAAVLATIPFLSVSAIGPATSGCISTFARPSALDQPIFEPEEDDHDIIQIPSVTREDVDDLTSIQPHATNTVKLRLPLGVILTGGYKLRDEGLTGKGVRVAVIDGGVDAKHPDFKKQVKQQRWYRDGEWYCDGTKDDHGTHVAGTIHMLAPEAEIYNYCVFESGSTTNRAIAEAIKLAIYDGCQIINMSFGASQQNKNIAIAISVAHDNNVLMIVSAGNDGDNNPRTYEYRYPAMNSKTISVAAVSKEKGLPTADFSNNNNAVDYAGIGVDVISFEALSGGYKLMSGTSMASPHVCGFVAALMTKDRPYSDIIKDDKSLRTFLDDRFCMDLGGEDPKIATGRGFLTYLNKKEFKDVDRTDYKDIWFSL